MPPRFEIVSAPVEERLQKGLTSQVESTLNTAHSLLSGLTNKSSAVYNTTSSALADPRFVNKVSHTAVALLLPNSLPGFLLIASAILHLLHVFMLGRMARQAVQSQYHARAKTD